MSAPKLDSMLLASTDPERLRTWYSNTLDPESVTEMDGYRVLKFGGFHLLIDERSDVADTNPDPARVILNFDVEDAEAIVARMESAGVRWVAELENRDGSFFATGQDPDGNYVQIIELSEEHRADMEASA